MRLLICFYIQEYAFIMNKDKTLNFEIKFLYYINTILFEVNII